MIIQNYLLISLRNLIKNRVFIGINVFGMGIAIACSVIAYLNFRSNLYFDAHHENAGGVYRVSAIREVASEEKSNASVPVPLGAAIRANAGDVRVVMRFYPSRIQVSVKDDLAPVLLSYVDPEFFKVFTFRFLSGKSTALEHQSAIFLSASASKRLYGTIDVLGKTVRQVSPAGEVKEYEIAAVFEDQPITSSFQGDAFVAYDNYFGAGSRGRDDWSQVNNLFVQIDHPERIAALEKQLQTYRDNVNPVAKNYQVKRFYLEPFAGMAQRDSRSGFAGALTTASTPFPIVIALALMALLMLAIACFNLTNTLVAISTKRLKEIGLRKVMGSERIQLIIQFIGEAVLICFVSFLIGLGMSDLLVLAWNEMWPFLKLELKLIENVDVLLFLGAVVLITGTLSGVYPAFYVSRFQPAQILKGKIEIGGTNYFTRTLLVLQFAFSVTALFFSIAFYQNSLFQKNFPLGFAHSEVLVVPVKSEAEFDKMRNALIHQPGVAAMGGSADHVFSTHTTLPVTCNGIDIEADLLRVGEDYRSTLGFELLEGRDFNPASANDHKESVIITQDLAEGFAPASALDKTITINDSVKLYVIGVIKDVYSRGMWKEKVPMVLRYTGKENYRNLIVHTSGEKAAGVAEYMKKQWSELFPGRPYMGYRMDEIINVAEDVNRNVTSIFTFLAIVALLLSIAGLYSSVSLNIARRLKEVGIRKVFGASIAQIIWATNVQFVAILTLSVLAGCWLGSMLVGVMMKQIWTYYQAGDMVTFTVSIITVLWLAGIMIGSKVYQAASANPIHALREE